MATLERAILLAAQAHEGQIDKAGEPYILHPLRIMLRMTTPTAMTVAVLHDVVEDTRVTPEMLRGEGFSEGVLETLDCLTRRKDEDYDTYIERIKSNPEAVRVKIADLEDNMDIRRIADLRETDLERLKKYHRAWLALAGRGK
jgi:(p)ppGpp synthase/HD superfamily hydrolase